MFTQLESLRGAALPVPGKGAGEGELTAGRKEPCHGTLKNQAQKDNSDLKIHVRTRLQCLEHKLVFVPAGATHVQVLCC